MAAQTLGGIYEIVNIQNQKRYVGSAVDFDHRWKEHRKFLRAEKHHSPHLQRAWNKHGADAFEFRVIRFCEPDRLIAEEQAEFDRCKPEYNICPNAGSTLGRRHSAQTRRKIAAKKRGSMMPPRSDEYRAKLSAAHKGRAKSPTHLEALQAGRRARVTTEDQRLRVSQSLKRAYDEGRHRRDKSTEYRAKIANTLRKRSNCPNIRQCLRDQAIEAWAKRSVQERHAHMAKMRASRKPMTDEQRQAISDRQIGKAWTPERKLNHEAAMKAYFERKRLAATED